MRSLSATYSVLSAIAIVLATSLSIVACDGSGVTEGVGEGDGAGGEEGDTAWITGEWAGNVRGKENGQDGANLVETTVEAKFTSDQAKTGSFEFLMPQLDKVVVKGTFADFAGKSLLLTIKESNFSTLGMPGNTTDLDYALVGDALELSNARIVLKLIRKSDGSGAGDGGEDGDTTPSAFVDDWSCGDQAGRTWKLNLGSENTFAIKVYDVPSPVLMMTGEYTIENETVVMNVANSSQTNYVGQLLTAKLEGEGTLRLYRMIRTGNDTATAGDNFTCGRD